MEATKPAVRLGLPLGRSGAGVLNGADYLLSPGRVRPLRLNRHYANRKSNKDILRGRRDILRRKKDILRRNMDIHSKHVYRLDDRPGERADGRVHSTEH